MDEHSGGFIDDDEVVVFENDVEVDIFSSHRRPACAVDSDLDKIVWFEPIADIFVTAVHLAFACFYEVAQVHFAQALEMPKQKIFEPHS